MIRRSEEGSAMVESALTIGILLLLLLGIFDLGRMMYIYADISEAAREGARYGSAHLGDTAGTRNAVISHSMLGLTAANVTVQFNETIPAVVNVTVTYTYHAISVVIQRLAGGSGGMVLTNRSRMMVE